MALRGAVAVVLAAFLLGATAAEAAERTTVLRSADGTPIHVSFFPAPGLEAGERAPTVLGGTGYASGRPRCVGDPRCRMLTTLSEAGYNVVTWDPRGFGDSGGVATADGPQTDGRDVQAVIDHTAAQPEARLDAPGDPRVGMTGESYGGTIQLVAAALDQRIDAIAPALTWHDLADALHPAATFKASWMTIFALAGELFGLADGLDAQPGPQLGTQDPHILRFWAVGLATGTPLAEDVAWLRSRGPWHLLSRVRAPTLLMQSTADTLFPLRHAVRTAAVLRAGGVAVKELWFCGGGHGGCDGDAGSADHVEQAELRWFARWLRDEPVDTGAPAEWLADDGVWREAAQLPLAATGVLRGTGAGTLSLVPGDVGAQGAPITAALSPAPPVPDPRAVRARLAAPAAPVLVAGAPRLRLRYAGVAVPAEARVFAQLVDEVGNRVVGWQVTPFPVMLNGTARTVQVELELVALRLTPASRLRVEIVPATGLFFPQRSLGTVRVLEAAVELPTSPGA